MNFGPLAAPSRLARLRLLARTVDEIAARFDDRAMIERRIVVENRIEAATNLQDRARPVLGQLLHDFALAIAGLARFKGE